MKKIVSGNLPNAFNFPVTVDKIVVNYYYTKSAEEFMAKIQRGRCDQVRNNYNMTFFEQYNRNEVFDDGILKYRAARADSLHLESDGERLRRVSQSLNETLSKYANDELFDLETALTCRALSNYLGLKIHEEASLAAILKSLKDMNLAGAQLFIRELPKLLRLPYPVVEELRGVALQIIPKLMDFMRLNCLWKDYVELDYISDLLKE